MSLNLKLRSWPALASHFAFFLLGLSMAHISRDSGARSQVDKRHSLIAVNDNWLLRSKDLNGQDQVMFIRESKGEKSCQAYPFALPLFHRDHALYLVVRSSELSQAAQLTDAKRGYKLASVSLAKSLPVCRKPTEIIFGS